MDNCRANKRLLSRISLNMASGNYPLIFPISKFSDGAPLTIDVNRIREIFMSNESRKYVFYLKIFSTFIRFYFSFC